MNGQVVSGWAMTVVGTTTVFLALSLLVTVLSIVARLIEGRTTVQAAPKPAPRTVAPPSPSDDDPILLEAALAAYGAHRARRVVVRPPSEASAWRLGGRSEQLHRWR